MKKTVISLCLSIMILLIGSANEIRILGDNNKSKASRDDSSFSQIKLELSRFPKKYTADAVVKDGCFVVMQGVLKSKKTLLIHLYPSLKVEKQLQ